MPSPVHLDQPLAQVPGIRPALVRAVDDAFGYLTVRDLLEHYPRRYVTRGGLTDLAHAKKGALVTVVGEVKGQARKQPKRNLRILEVRVSDGYGVVGCTWFNQPWHGDKLPKGTLVAVSGVLQWRAGRLTMANPDYEVLSEVDDVEGFADAVIPVYPATKDVSSGRLRQAIGQLLERLDGPEEFLPARLGRERGLVSRSQALRWIHRPPDQAATEAARRRLVYDELFVLQVALALKRRATAHNERGAPLDVDGPLTKALLDRLPFRPTGAQRRVIAEIGGDLGRARPMHRLLQGDVGSGKAQPLDALVLTPAGFRRMGDLRVGDEVVNPTGEVTVVTGVHPQGEREVWRLVLDDGAAVECDDEHLWALRACDPGDPGAPAPGELHVLTTRQLREGLTGPDGAPRWQVPVAAAAELEGGQERLLDPYALGSLLGDVAGRPAAAPGRVPGAYRDAPVKVRHALLQGVLDAGGTPRPGRGAAGGVTFVTASRLLASDVRWLVASLGGVARVRSVRRSGHPELEVGIRLPRRYPPSRRRRPGLAEPAADPAGRAVSAVEHVGRKPVQCISVAHPNQLYVTDDFVVTHNTVVALWALLAAVQSGAQGAIMAPTEVLADQHYLNLRGLLDRTVADAPDSRTLFGGPRIEVLTAAVTGAARTRVLEAAAAGEIDILVGTHALLGEGVGFRRLGMAVVDEQHRFGVHQRVKLREKGDSPHVLIMTATPIPRTLALTLYGDLDVSVLDELPPGRTPVATHVVAEQRLRDRAYQRIREEVGQGHQAYVVCALKDESDKLQVRSAKAEAERLRGQVFPDLRVGLVYGDMAARDKEAAMDAFRAGATDVLVSTSVIEVGVDVPNATVMLIEDADRFGLSQLHQLRGRVGRGAAAGLCVLFADPATEEGRRRMRAIASSTDGFRLADEDLRIRGEGTVFDARQSGVSDLKIARLVEDVDQLVAARQDAFSLVEEDPALRAPAHAALRGELRARLGDGRADWLSWG
ncbi:MAG TPA: helicase-related protein [Actinomycetes bacterium]|nr:helicase-related protein [Actinomycetes bacterium]